MSFLTIQKYYFKIAILLLIASCSEKSDININSGVSIPLNTTEKLLVGKWILSSKTDTLYMSNIIQNGATKSYTKPTSRESYLEFLSTKFVSNLVPNADSRSKNGNQQFCSFPENKLGAISLVSSSARWYYDDAMNYLNWNGEKITIVKISNTELVFKVFLEDLNLKYKHSITWRFVK